MRLLTPYAALLAACAGPPLPAVSEDAGTDAAAITESTASTVASTTRATDDPLAEFDPSHTIRGLVLDESRRPVEGVTVYAGVYTNTRPIPSDAAGRFGIGIGFGYETGTGIYLTFRAPGFVRQQVVVPLGEQDRTIVLDRGSSLAGRLTAGVGGELPKTLEVMLRGNSGTHDAVARNGTFEMSGFEPGENANVEVRVDGWVPFWFSGLELTDGEVRDLGELALERGAAVEVVAMDAFEEPVAGAFVSIESVEPPRLYWYATTDADGTAHVTGITPGIGVRVTTTPPEGFGRSLAIEHVQRSIELGDAESRLDVVLHRPVALRGELVWNGGGDAPWLADRRLRIHVRGSRDGEPPWHHDGTVPDLGQPIGERESTDFVVWAPPGTWSLELAIQREGEYRSELAPIGTFEIPEPARGENSGELRVGRVEWPNKN